VKNLASHYEGASVRMGRRLTPQHWDAWNINLLG
jgi:hypothetical protein